LVAPGALVEVGALLLDPVERLDVAIDVDDRPLLVALARDRAAIAPIRPLAASTRAAVQAGDAGRLLDEIAIRIFRDFLIFALAAWPHADYAFEMGREGQRNKHSVGEAITQGERDRPRWRHPHTTR